MEVSNDPYLEDQEQGPSGLAQKSSSADTTKAVAGTSDSSSFSLSENSVSQDSFYDKDSAGDGFMFELSDSTIQKRVEAIESGLVQVTLKKCSYSLGF